MARISKDIAEWLLPEKAKTSWFHPALWLKRHPVPISAFFRDSLVLTYALPRRVLEPLLPPGLMLDTFNDFGFVAVALVDTQSLRPTFCPASLGQEFFLAGYRIFVRYQTKAGRTLRGLRILRSDANRRCLTFFGNHLTHYNYHFARVACRHTGQNLEIHIQTPRAEADLHVIAHLDGQPAPLPAGSPFTDLREARRFAGPLPYTFDYESETDSIVMIEGVRREWKPQPVQVDVLENTFFRQAPFAGVQPVLANAFHVKNIPYQWRRGIRESLSKGHP